MSYAKHIFRPPSLRPYQAAIWKKFIPGTVFVAPVVGTTHVRPKYSTTRPPRINRQLKRKTPVHAPRRVSSGFLDVIRDRTERYARLHERAVFDVREVYREIHGAPEIVPDAGMVVFRTQTPRQEPVVGPVLVPKHVSTKAAPVQVQSFIFRRQQPSHELFREFRRARRKELPLGKALVALGADIGWLVSFIIKRGYGHNLRR